MQSSITSELINPNHSPNSTAATDARFLVRPVVALLPRQRDIQSGTWHCVTWHFTGSTPDCIFQVSMLVHDMAGNTCAQSVWMRTFKQAEPHVDIPV
jgi:hypothetical protein